METEKQPPAGLVQQAFCLSIYILNLCAILIGFFFLLAGPAIFLMTVPLMLFLFVAIRRETGAADEKAATLAIILNGISAFFLFLTLKKYGGFVHTYNLLLAATCLGNFFYILNGYQTRFAVKKSENNLRYYVSGIFGVMLLFSYFLVPLYRKGQEAQNAQQYQKHIKAFQAARDTEAETPPQDD